MNAVAGNPALMLETRNRANGQQALNGGALTNLPVANYCAGETILTAGSRSDQLLILKKGAVAVVKDSIEIATVEEPGAVFGELSALLDQPHTADVRALKDSQFYVAEAGLLGKDPSAVLHIAKVLARRLLAANSGFIEMKKQILMTRL